MTKHRIKADDIKWPCELEDDFKQKLLSFSTPISKLATTELSIRNPYFQGVYYIHTGVSYICLTELDLKPLNCGVFGSPSWVGAMFMLNFPELPLHVGEIEPCEILYFPKKKIQLLCKETDQTYRWLFHIANINALSFFQEKKIPHYESETRVIYYLLDLARLINKSEGGLPKINITQQLLSELCGVSRPSVNQLLKGLEGANLIKVGRNNINLTDIQGLRDKLADVNLIFNDPFPMPL